VFTRNKLALAAACGIAACAAAVMGGAPSQASTTPPATVRLDLAPSSAQLAACFPHAKAKVKVALTTEEDGKDVFTINAYGLRPNTPFTVFLIEKAGPPFGAAEYFGDFTTDRYGRAHNQFTLIVEEAFAFNNETHVRKELNSVGLWFADPKDDDECLGGKSPVTRFDGDDSAGVQMLNSGKQLLP
jgi:hypothetical protein